MTLQVQEKNEDSKYIGIQELKRRFLIGKLYLLDQNIESKGCSRPKKYFIKLADVLPTDIDDDVILDYSIRHDLINVTGDVEFLIKNLIKSRNVIYEIRDNKRQYFILKSVKKINTEKPSNLTKIKNTLFRKQTKYLIHGGDSRFKNLKYSHLNIVDNSKYRRKIVKHNCGDTADNFQEYASENYLTILTENKKICMKSLLNNKECVFCIDSELYHIKVDYFDFEDVKSKKVKEPDGFPQKDPLQNHLRFIRNYFTVFKDNQRELLITLEKKQEKFINSIQKNLDYIETELLNREDHKSKNPLGLDLEKMERDWLIRTIKEYSRIK